MLYVFFLTLVEDGLYRKIDAHIVKYRHFNTLSAMTQAPPTKIFSPSVFFIIEALRPAALQPVKFNV